MPRSDREAALQLLLTRIAEDAVKQLRERPGHGRRDVAQALGDRRHTEREPLLVLAHEHRLRQHLTEEEDEGHGDEDGRL